MRLLFPVAMAIAAAVSVQPVWAAAPTVPKRTISDASDCPGATSQWVRQGRVWQSQPVRPRKLAELPRGETFAAVYRLDERGCMVPVKYRDVRP